MASLAIIAALAVQQAALQPSQSLSLDVPSEIARTSSAGVEVFQLVISPEGKAITCDVHVAGKGPVADDQNCRKLLKLKWIPASDQTGQKTYGSLKIETAWNTSPARRSGESPPVTDVDLRLPIQRLPAGVSDGAVSYLVLAVAADGKVESCTTLRSSGHPGLDDAACRAIAAAGTLPLKDNAGLAVRSVQTVSVGFKVEP